MRITRRPDDPSTWELHELTPEDQEALARFAAQWGEAAVVDPYSPVLVRFADPTADAAFEQQFRGQVD